MSQLPDLASSRLEGTSRRFQNLQLIIISLEIELSLSFGSHGAPTRLCVCSTLRQVIEVDIPGCVISDDIRPLMLLCPNVKKINMVQDEMGDTSDVLDWEDDLRLLQREYPLVQFERHGVTFDYNRRREEVKKGEIALAESRA